jgi:hypothetical protein
MIILDLKSIHLSHKTVSFIAQALSICQCQRRGIVVSSKCSSGAEFLQGPAFQKKNNNIENTVGEIAIQRISIMKL